MQNSSASCVARVEDVSQVSMMGVEKDFRGRLLQWMEMERRVVTPSPGCCPTFVVRLFACCSLRILTKRRGKNSGNDGKLVIIIS